MTGKYGALILNLLFIWFSLQKHDSDFSTPVNNQELAMEQIRENLNEMRTEMGTNMGQCMEAIQTLALRQEELRQVLQRPVTDGIPTLGEGLVDQNVRNVVEIPIPTQENAHHENNLEL